MADVVVVGSGPTGMMLAGELALAGVDVEVLERRATPTAPGSRAGGIHSRTIELLDQRGIADRFLAAGRTAQTAQFAGTTLDIGDLPTRRPYGLALRQDEFEPILAGWIAELGLTARLERQVVGLAQDGDGVDLALSDGSSIRARYVVGADGGRSTVRKSAGIAFPGVDATRSTLIAEVEVSRQPPVGTRQDDAGVHGLQPMTDGRRYRVVTTERRIGPKEEPTLAVLSAALIEVYGTDFGVHDPTWISRFTDATRHAAEYRRGHVLLAGDAAHIHSPAGGQGIGLGMQDAVNLGWKLAQVVRGVSPDALLDTYGAERHPANTRALRHSMAQTVLQRHDPRTAALAETVDLLMAMDEPRIRTAALVHGLDVAYGPEDRHPQVGRRIPDLDLRTARGATTVFSLLHDARPLLLDLGTPGRFTGSAVPDRVRVVEAERIGVWMLPVIGAVAPPSAALIRPDGHVAWVDEPAVPSPAEALRLWFEGGPAGETRRG